MRESALKWRREERDMKHMNIETLMDILDWFDDGLYDYEDSYEETGIDENVVQDALFGMLCGDWSVEDTALESCRVSTFRDAGVMSNDAGLVLRLPDGSEFQITILQSR